MHMVFYKNSLKFGDIFDYMLIVIFCSVTLVLGTYESITDMM